MISVAETIPNGPFTNIGFLSALNTPPFVSLYYTEKQIVRRMMKGIQLFRRHRIGEFYT